MTKIQHPKPQHSGLTLVELLIASTIGIMMLIMTANLTVSIFKTRDQLQNLNEIQQSATSILQDFQDNIRWSNENQDIIVNSPTSITTQRGSPVTYTYNSTNKQILKNGNPLNPSSVQITNLNFQQINSSVSTHYLPLIRIQFTISSTKNSNINLTPDVTFSQKRTRYGP